MFQYLRYLSYRKSVRREMARIYFSYDKMKTKSKEEFFKNYFSPEEMIFKFFKNKRSIYETEVLLVQQFNTEIINNFSSKEKQKIFKIYHSIADIPRFITQFSEGELEDGHSNLVARTVSAMIQVAILCERGLISAAVRGEFSLRTLSSLGVDVSSLNDALYSERS